MTIAESEKALLKADLEADMKYKQLIMEAESLLESLKNSLQRWEYPLYLVNPLQLTHSMFIFLRLQHSTRHARGQSTSPQSAGQQARGDAQTRRHSGVQQEAPGTSTTSSTAGARTGCGHQQAH